MRSGSLDNETPTDDCSTRVRRVGGPEAEELFLVCRPQRTTADLVSQAESVYVEMLARLASEGASVAEIASETLFVRDIRADLEVILDTRRRILERSEQQPCSPVTAFIGQPPLTEGARLELCVHAVVPNRRQPSLARGVSSTAASNGKAASPPSATRIRVGDETHLRAGNIYGAGENAFEQAHAMFCSAEGLLREAGMGFGDVVRTWIYLRDMDRDYDEFNRARRDFFRSRDLELKPASTAVGGVPFPDGHDFSLRVYAMKAPRPLHIEIMSAPTLNEAWTYGSDFSRGLKVTEANKITLHVSGTASVDEAGRTVHVGDFKAQAERMLINISSLLAVHGASFHDLVSAVAYVKNASDAPLLRAMFQQHGFEGFPCTLVEADICRPDLLCETEAVAVLPPPESRR